MFMCKKYGTYLATVTNPYSHYFLHVEILNLKGISFKWCFSGLNWLCIRRTPCTYSIRLATIPVLFTTNKYQGQWGTKLHKKISGKYVYVELKYTFPLLLKLSKCNCKLSNSEVSKCCGYEIFICNSQQKCPSWIICVTWVHVLRMFILYKLAWLTNAACRTSISRFTFACVRCYAGSMQAILWTHGDAVISRIALHVAFAAVFYRPCLRHVLTTQTALLFNTSVNNCYTNTYK